MIIFYDKSNKIISTISESFGVAKDCEITVEENGKQKYKKGDIKQMILNPKESKDFEDPRNSKNIHNYKVDTYKKLNTITIKE